MTKDSSPYIRSCNTQNMLRTYVEYIHVNDNGAFYIFLKTCIFSYFPTNIHACSFSRRRKKKCASQTYNSLELMTKNVLSLTVLIFLFMVIIET